MPHIKDLSQNHNEMHKLVDSNTCVYETNTGTALNTPEFLIEVVIFDVI